MMVQHLTMESCYQWKWFPVEAVTLTRTGPTGSDNVYQRLETVVNCEQVIRNFIVWS